LLLVSFNSISQNESVELVEKEILNSVSNLSILFHAVKSDSSAFFTQGLIVENPELDGCADIASNEVEIEVILAVIQDWNLGSSFYVEGENGIVNLATQESVDMNRNSLNIYLYFDSDTVINPVYIGIENKKEAKKFLSILIEKLESSYCLSRLKRKL